MALVASQFAAVVHSSRNSCATLPEQQPSTSHQIPATPYTVCGSENPGESRGIAVREEEQLLSISFNQDSSFFACATSWGFRIFCCQQSVHETLSRVSSPASSAPPPLPAPASPPHASAAPGASPWPAASSALPAPPASAASVQHMLYRCNFLALVGGGDQPRYPKNKVIIWDDNQGLAVGELSFRSEVRGVCLRRERVVVALAQRVFVYALQDLRLLLRLPTLTNTRGLVAISQAPAPFVLACPGVLRGQGGCLCVRGLLVSVALLLFLAHPHPPFSLSCLSSRLCPLPAALPASSALSPCHVLSLPPLLFPPPPPPTLLPSPPPSLPSPFSSPPLSGPHRALPLARPPLPLPRFPLRLPFPPLPLLPPAPSSSAALPPAPLTITITAHETALAALALSPDGTRVATASVRGTLVRVFSTADGPCCRSCGGALTEQRFTASPSPPTGTSLHFPVIRAPHIPVPPSLLVPLPPSLTSHVPSLSPLPLLPRSPGVLPRYFSSEWSLAQFRHLPDCRSLVAFGAQRNTLLVACMDGSFHRLEFDPVGGGEMKREEHTRSHCPALRGPLHLFRLPLPRNGCAQAPPSHARGVLFRAQANARERDVPATGNNPAPPFPPSPSADANPARVAEENERAAPRNCAEATHQSEEPETPARSQIQPNCDSNNLPRINPAQSPPPRSPRAKSPPGFAPRSVTPSESPSLGASASASAGNRSGVPLALPTPPADAATGAHAGKFPPLKSLLREPSWAAALGREFDEPYMRRLQAFLDEEVSRKERVFPPAASVFEALNRCPMERARVVIIGQDPYHGPGQAVGLSFSVPRGTPLPSSLQNVFKEMRSDGSIAAMPAHGCLRHWADQGVLLLNTVLTGECG
ncbi:unnamed protein product [Closterium sp. Yama58-4]|nr:unnamed protein product [Closterium sp. Yama58-4]